MKKDHKSKSYKSAGHNSSADGHNDSTSDNSDNSDAENEDETPKIDYRVSSAANHARCGHHGHGVHSGNNGHHNGPNSNLNYPSHSLSVSHQRTGTTYISSNQKSMSTGSSSSPLSSSSSSSNAPVSTSSSSSSTPNSVGVNSLNTSTLSSLLSIGNGVNSVSVGSSSPPVESGYVKYQMGLGDGGSDSQYYQASGNNTAEGFYSGSDLSMDNFLTNFK